MKANRKQTAVKLASQFCTHVMIRVVPTPSGLYCHVNKEIWTTLTFALSWVWSALLSNKHFETGQITRNFPGKVSTKCGNCWVSNSKKSGRNAKRNGQSGWEISGISLIEIEITWTSDWHFFIKWKAPQINKGVWRTFLWKAYGRTVSRTFLTYITSLS